MKLSQDQIKKLAMMVLGLGALYYCLFEFVISPANSKVEGSNKKVEELEKKIRSAKATIASVQQAEAKQKADETLIQFFESKFSTIPSQNHYPIEVKEEFQKAGYTVSPANVAQVDPSLRRVGENYQRLAWYTSVPQITYHEVARLIADIENRNPMWEVVQVELARAGGNSTKLEAKMIVATVEKVNK